MLPSSSDGLYVRSMRLTVKFKWVGATDKMPDLIQNVDGERPRIQGERKTLRLRGTLGRGEIAAEGPPKRPPCTETGAPGGVCTWAAAALLARGCLPCWRRKRDMAALLAPCVRAQSSVLVVAWLMDSTAMKAS